MTAGLWDPSHEREKVFFGGRLEKGTCLLGFPGSSTGKNPPAIRETRGSIPGSGRSPGEGIGYQLQYSWSSLAAQMVKMVKNPPAMWETRV